MPLPLLADSLAPDFNVAWVIIVVLRVLHIASAATLFGGMLYLKQVVAPAADGDDPTQSLYRGQRKAWAMAVMIATTFLLLSGFYNYYRIMTVYEKLPPLYHALFGIKFLLAFFVMYVAAGTAGKTPLALEMQKHIQKWLNRGLAAVLGIFVLAAMMGTFYKVPIDFTKLPAAGTQPAPAAEESPAAEETPATEAAPATEATPEIEATPETETPPATETDTSADS